MLSTSCRIKSHVVLLSFLAIVSCLSVALFYRFVTNKAKIFKRYHGINQVSPMKQDSNCVLFNVAVWTENICRETFDNLQWFSKFPNFPDLTVCEDNVSSVARNGMHILSIRRTLVSLSNLEPGFYQLRAKTYLPLRIYVGDRYQSSGRNLVLVSSESTNLLTVLSKSFFLDKNSHLEIVTYSPPGDNLLELDWLVPGSAHFVPMLSRDLLPVVHVMQSQNPLREVQPPDKSTLVGFIPRAHVSKAFRVCSLSQMKLGMNYHSSLNITVYTESSPLDEFIHAILKLIMDSLQKVAPSKYPAHKLNRIELAQNSSLTGTKGSRRLFVDLNLTVDGLDYFERFGEYLHAYHDGNRLECCRPLRYQWDRTVSLTFVFLSHCSRNDSPWGLYFIENTIEILQRSLEVNFGVIITACDHEQRRGYESRLRASDIDRNEIVMPEEVYQKSRAMKAVLSLVEGDGIVVVCESRVKMPTGISEEVRKHTFKASMAYSPTVFQLDCGYFPENKQVLGNWCQKCEGVTAMYKEDWVQILSSHDGSKDIMKDKTELLYHIARTGIEIAQVKLKDLYRL